MRKLRQKLNHAWRLLGTAMAFSIFGLGGLFLSQISFPLIRLLYRDPVVQRRKAKYLVHRCFALFVWFIRTFGVVGVKMEGLEKVKEDRGCVIVANHPSLLDVVFLISVYPQANCVVKKGLWSNFFVKGAVSGTGYIANDGSEDILKDCRRAFDEGDVLIIFPEGTRTTPGEEIKFKRGAAQIALFLEVPIRLVSISVNPTTLTKSEPWYSLPSEKAIFSLKIGDKIDPKDYPTKEEPRSIAARKLTRFMAKTVEPRREAL